MSSSLSKTTSFCECPWSAFFVALSPTLSPPFQRSPPCWRTGNCCCCLWGLLDDALVLLLQPNPSLLLFWTWITISAKRTTWATTTQAIPSDHTHSTIATVLDLSPPPSSFTAFHVQQYEVYADWDWDEAEKIQSHSAVTLMFLARYQNNVHCPTQWIRTHLLSGIYGYSTVSLNRKAAEIQVPF